MYGEVSIDPGTIPLNLGGDPDRQSGLWMNVLKTVIAGELLVITTQTIPMTMLYQVD